MKIVEIDCTMFVTVTLGHPEAKIVGSKLRKTASTQATFTHRNATEQRASVFSFLRVAFRKVGNGWILMD
jgi:hypothetical protein